MIGYIDNISWILCIGNTISLGYYVYMYINVYDIYIYLHVFIYIIQICIGCTCNHGYEALTPCNVHRLRVKPPGIKPGVPFFGLGRAAFWLASGACSSSTFWEIFMWFPQVGVPPNHPCMEGGLWHCHCFTHIT